MALIPAVMAAIGCGAAGMIVASSLRKRELLLDAWVHSVTRMKITLNTQHLPLHGVLENGLGEHASIDERIQYIINVLKEKPAMTLLDAWHCADKAFPSSYEKAEEKLVLEKLFKDLGTGSIEKRRELISQSILSLETIHKQAFDTQHRNGRLYKNLGWLGGLALMLMLI